jgi:predicted acylesterase/phospholipase RssA
MGAIATRGAAQDLELFRRILVASAAIPGFFPPVSIPVEVDGVVTEELHVDGGVTASLFFWPPQVPKELAKTLSDKPLENSNLYIIVAGKLYADPMPVERKLLSIVENSVSALLYSQTRGDLFQMFALTLATGMNYRLASVPMDLDAPKDATTFDPIEMTKLYEAGRKYAKENRVWRTLPPGLRPGELVPVRGGIKLVTAPEEPRGAVK